MVKYISLSFDDGRNDFYLRAYPILKKYGLTATLHVTTGWVDGTWTPKEWKSAGMPLSKETLLFLNAEGVEISSHGDCHITEPNDSERSVRKLQDWCGIEDKLGFSIPNSELSKSQIEEFIRGYAEKKFLYIRRGRDESSYTLLSKMGYILYNLIPFQPAYNFFNRKNGNTFPLYLEKYFLNSVVIKEHDKVRYLKEYLKRNTSDWVIFMLHSILKVSDIGYKADPWYWDEAKFEELCAFLAMEVKNGNTQVVTIKDMILNFN